MTTVPTGTETGSVSFAKDGITVTIRRERFQYIDSVTSGTSIGPVGFTIDVEGAEIANVGGTVRAPITNMGSEIAEVIDGRQVKHNPIRLVQSPRISRKAVTDALFIAIGVVISKRNNVVQSPATMLAAGRAQWATTRAPDGAVQKALDLAEAKWRGEVVA